MLQVLVKLFIIIVLQRKLFELVQPSPGRFNIT